MKKVCTIVASVALAVSLAGSASAHTATNNMNHSTKQTTEYENSNYRNNNYTNPNANNVGNGDYRTNSIRTNAATTDRDRGMDWGWLGLLGLLGLAGMRKRATDHDHR
ncbi:WGxxGxxG family protein [Paenibacillus tundrae]|uniref:MYXO-CTERM domain-containing protein n=1 Tax=Paenibacillus tundrae TaxID=528187 RepID=A0ABT9WK61_9BACL|nr:WGxxGxxG family protein [Paenibacillus tundrae]MDQ0173665.1 MYXO-CTERM domain-containing protein [Paenibacillus tundrae]